jgi:hypothetical protein
MIIVIYGSFNPLQHSIFYLQEVKLQVSMFSKRNKMASDFEFFTILYDVHSLPSPVVGINVTNNTEHILDMIEGDQGPIKHDI